MTRPHNPNSERVLILAPHGRDAQVACSLLADADLTPVVISDLNELVQGLVETAAAVLVRRRQSAPAILPL